MGRSIGVLPEHLAADAHRRADTTAELHEEYLAYVGDLQAAARGVDIGDHAYVLGRVQELERQIELELDALERVADDCRAHAAR